MSLENNDANSTSRAAIKIRGLSKSYGTSKKPTHVLRSLNMTVAQNSIYALLGPRYHYNNTSPNIIYVQIKMFFLISIFLFFTLSFQIFDNVYVVDAVKQLY